MTTFPSFVKIWALGQKHISTIFDSEVEITEKVDGSQFGFGIIDGELICRSKGKELCLDAPEKMFTTAVEYIKSIQNRLFEGVWYYGEYLQKPKHNTLSYDRIPKNNIALYAVRGPTGIWATYEEMLGAAFILELDTVPLIYQGIWNPTADLKSLLNTKSYLGGADIEGIVVKNYSKDYILGGQHFPIMCGKFVSEKFKEVHQKGWKKENTGKGKLEVFMDQFCTEARMHKAIQHLRDNGELTYSPKDIGNLIKEASTDVEVEEKENIKEALWQIFGKDIKRNATKNIPQWYKEWLIEQSFEGE